MKPGRFSVGMMITTFCAVLLGSVASGIAYASEEVGRHPVAGIGGIVACVVLIVGLIASLSYAEEKRSS